jgi:hypothetical protein
MISIAGPSASDITSTERRIAAEPGLGPGEAGDDCARPKAPSDPTSSENRRIWQAMRGKDVISRGKGPVDRTISPRLGSGEVTEGGCWGRASGVGPRTSDLGLQASDLWSQVAGLRPSDDTERVNYSTAFWLFRRKAAEPCSAGRVGRPLLRGRWGYVHRCGLRKPRSEV